MTRANFQEVRFVPFLGTAVDAVSLDYLIEKTDEWLKDKKGRSHHVACINAYCVTLALEDERLQRIYGNADIAGADGMRGVVWIRFVQRLHCDRYYAPDVIRKLVEASEKKRYTFFLYGGSEEVLKEMRDFLIQTYPFIRIVGVYSPPFRDLTSEEDEQVVSMINSLRPDILAVGLGTPKQDYWIDDHIEKIRGSVMVASGATFDFFGGRIRMAPLWIQRSGFEWVYRLFSKDFKRLWRRYSIMNLAFLWNFFLQVLRIKGRSAGRCPRIEC